MMLPIRRFTYTPEKFNAAAAAKLGSVGNVWELPSDNPIEEIRVTCCLTVNAQLTTVQPDSILNLCKRIQVVSNNGKTIPRWDTSGIGALEFVSQQGLNLDRSTLEAIRLSQGATIAASSQIRLTYRLPMVHPLVEEPLRTRMLFPVHTHAQDAKLILDFAALAEFASAGSVTAMVVTVQVVTKQMPQEITQAILAKGGFIEQDVIETAYNLGVGVSGDVALALPLTGSYTGCLFRMYKGGATITRDVIDENTTFGGETIWRLETNQETRSQWRWRELQVANDESKVANVLSQTSSPGFGGVVAANTFFLPSSSVYLDFLSDGMEARELGSVLDVNPQALATPTSKMEVKGRVSNTATNGHVVNIIGHRLFGDLSSWKKFDV